MIHCYDLYLLFTACWFTTLVNKFCFPMLSLYQLPARIWFAQPVSHQQEESLLNLAWPRPPYKQVLETQLSVQAMIWRLNKLRRPLALGTKIQACLKIPKIKLSMPAAHISYNVSVENLALNQSRKLLPYPRIKRKTVFFVECNEIWVFVVLGTANLVARNSLSLDTGVPFGSYLIFQIFNVWMPRSTNTRLLKSTPLNEITYGIALAIKNISVLCTYLSPSFISRGRSLSSLMIPVPSGSNVVNALLIMSSGSVPCMFSENSVINMVKLTVPVASPNMSSMYSSFWGLPRELNISVRSLALMIPSRSWSITLKASLNSWICVWSNIANTLEVARWTFFFDPLFFDFAFPDDILIVRESQLRKNFELRRNVNAAQCETHLDGE